MISTFGRHLVAEYFGCRADVLNDLGTIRRLLEHAATSAGANIVQTVAHQFTPQGVSVVVVIEESHLSIHTWPEEGYAAVDFYTCGECDPEVAHQVLAEGLAADATEVVTLHRGMKTTERSVQVVGHRTEDVNDSSAREGQQCHSGTTKPPVR